MENFSNDVDGEIRQIFHSEKGGGGRGVEEEI